MSPKDFLTLAAQENIISIMIKIKVVTVDYLIGATPTSEANGER
jgi:hypothetical protein